MGPLRIPTMLLAILFTAGCSAPPPPPPPKTVFDPLTQDLDRAHAVQQTVNENTEKSSQAEQAQENGDAAP